MPRYAENDLLSAVSAVRSGSSIRQAAHDFGVPRSTLSERLDGTKPHKKAHSNQMRLSLDQEAKLAEWALTQGQLGLPVSHAQIKEFAGRILLAAGDSTPLGKRWMKHFLLRNPEIKTRPTRRTESKRAEAATAEEIETRFNLRVSETQSDLEEDISNKDFQIAAQKREIEALRVVIAQLESRKKEEGQDRSKWPIC